MTTGEAGEPAAKGGCEAGRDRLHRARLCVLVAGGDEPAAFERLVADLFAAGVSMVQLRDKRLGDEALADRCRRALAAARRYDRSSPPLVILNDRVDLAASTGVDGVHLGATDMPVPEARRLLGPDRLIGRTTHDLAEAQDGLAAGADYLGAGPCYPSSTKTFVQHAPRAFLAAAASLPLPVFAIGGVTADRLADLSALGIDRVAVAAAVTAAADPVAAARTLLDAMERHARAGP